MNLDKLKLDKYRSVRFIDLPEGVTPEAPSAVDSFDCLVAFVRTQAQLDAALAKVLACSDTTGLVLAYPKGTSKNYTSELNRDTIVTQIKQNPQIKAPRLVSLDADWSGFSFRFEPAKA